MGAFGVIERAIQCECYGWPKSPGDMQLAASAYNREVGRFEKQLEEAALRRKQDLVRKIAGLHGTWENLRGQRQYHLNHKRQLPADLLLPQIQAAELAWLEACTELEAWTPVWVA